MGYTIRMSPLAQKTYRLLQTVPVGRVTTYKALSQALGVKAYRAIGQIMRTNPFAPTVPCHRVVTSDGAIGGFKGNGQGKAIQEKIALLQKEGIHVHNNRIVNFPQVLFTFEDKASL